MRARTTATAATNHAAEARESLRARYDAGRAWRLGVPERATGCLQEAISLEAGVPAAVLRDVYAEACELALLTVDLEGDGALERLAELGAESWQRRVRAAAPSRAWG